MGAVEIVVALLAAVAMAIAVRRYLEIRKRQREEIERAVAAERAEREARAAAVRTVEAILRSGPPDVVGMLGHLRELLKMRTTTEERKRVYYHVLGCLAADPKLKPWALTLGRWHYRGARPDENLTVYDEQAIRNDIEAYM